MIFESFPKIGRLKRDCLVTEKIDGSNGQIAIIPNTDTDAVGAVAVCGDFTVYAGSRNRWVQPGSKTDNAGFAGWVRDNASELVGKLGPGRHFGEWWGNGIQRGYGLSEKRFSLFNAFRWADGRQERPSCCGVVPTLYMGVFDSAAIEHCISKLQCGGSIAAPDYMKPEGVIVYHGATKTYFKRLIENDEEPKGLAA